VNTQKCQHSRTDPFIFEGRPGSVRACRIAVHKTKTLFFSGLSRKLPRQLQKRRLRLIWTEQMTYEDLALVNSGFGGNAHNCHETSRCGH